MKEEIINKLKNPDWQVRLTTAQDLGISDDPEAVDLLISLLADDKWEVRRAAVESLGNLKKPEAVGPLTAAFDDGDWRIRQGAAFALGYVGSGESIRPLIEKMKNDEDWHVRQACAAALKNYSGKQVVESLVWAMKNDPDWHARVQAVESLGEIGDPLAKRPIESAIIGADPRSGLSMKIALKKIRASEMGRKTSGIKQKKISRQELVDMKKQAGSCDGCVGRN